MKVYRQIRTIAELLEAGEDAPIPLDVFPNQMGINLCSVKEVEWVEQEDGQLVELTVRFIPAEGGVENAALVAAREFAEGTLVRPAAKLPDIKPDNE